VPVHSSWPGYSSRIRKPGFESIGVIAVYLPPHASSSKREWVPDLIRDVERLYTTLNRKCHHTFIIGDMNMQLTGTGAKGLSRHVDTDSITTLQSTPSLLSLCKKLKVSPVQGRSATCKAFATSRSITAPEAITGVESDYVLTSVDSRVSPRSDSLTVSGVEYEVTPLSLPRLDAMPHNFTHCWVGAIVKLAAKPRGEGLRVVKAQRTPRPRFYVPQYGDYKTWTAIGSSIMKALKNIDTVGTTAETLVNQLGEILKDAMTEHASNPEKSRWKHAIGNFKPERMHKGLPAPPRLLACIRERQSAVRNLRSKCFALKHLPSPARTAAQAQHRATIEAAVTALRQQVVTLNKQFKRIELECRRSTEERVRQAVHNTSIFDVHVLFKKIINILAPEPYTATQDTSFFDDEEGQMPAIERFTKHYQALLGTVHAPVAAESDNSPWLAVLKSADGSRLTMKFTAEEVYHVLYHAHKDVDLFPCVVEGCTICAESRTELLAYDPENVLQEAPRHKPKLQTSNSSGPNNVPAESFCWPQSDDLLTFRMAVCTLLARIFNLILTSEEIPTQLLEFFTTPLRKYGKPGQTLNHADPNNTRGITCGNTIGKIFGLVILKRLSHWAEHNKLISPEQTAFQNRRSSELHVWTMQTVLNYRVETKQETHVLFADFTKAYDMLHRPFLWKVLKKIGVPEKLINIIRKWHDQSVTRLKINGTLSAPIDMKTGVLQGAVLSPLLFNFVMETLIRFINAQPNLRGIRIGPEDDIDSIIIKILMFADDAASFGETQAEITEMFGVIDQWCKDTGMQLGLGNGKTEAMAVASPDAEAQLSRTIIHSGKTVKYTSEYKYLGQIVRANRSEVDTTSQRANKMNLNYHRLIKHSPILSSIPNSTMIMIIKNTMVGGVLYASGMTPPTKANTDKLDAVLRKSLKDMLRVPKHGFPTSAVTAYTGQLSMADVIMKEISRIVTTLSHHSNSDLLAAKVYKAMRSLPSSQAPWRTASKRIQTRMQSNNVTPITEATINALPRTEALQQPLVQTRQQAVHKFHDKTRYAVTAPRNHCLQPPRDNLSRASVADCVARPHPTSARVRVALHKTLGKHKYAPIGHIGPGCQGALPILSRLPSKKTAVIYPLVTNRMALLHSPFRIKHQIIRTRDRTTQIVSSVQVLDDADNAQLVKQAKRQQSSAVLNSTVDVVCPLCDGADGSYHIMVTCQHAVMTAIRAIRQSKLRRILNTELPNLVQNTRIAHTLAAAGVTFNQEDLRLPETWNWNTVVGEFVYWRHCIGLLWTNENIPWNAAEWLEEGDANGPQTRNVTAGPYTNVPSMTTIPTTDKGSVNYAPRRIWCDHTQLQRPAGHAKLSLNLPEPEPSR
jgi:hypothetical protein